MLEQFTHSVPVRVATYISEQKAENVAAVAVLADDYVLTHRCSFGAPVLTLVSGTGVRSDFAGMRVKVIHVIQKKIVITVINGDTGRQIVTCCGPSLKMLLLVHR